MLFNLDTFVCVYYVVVAIENNPLGDPIFAAIKENEIQSVSSSLFFLEAIGA